MNIRQIILSVLVGILLCLLALEVPRAIAVRNDAYRWFDPIVDIRGIIVSDYVNEPDEEEMQERRGTAVSLLPSAGSSGADSTDLTTDYDTTLV